MAPVKTRQLTEMEYARVQAVTRMRPASLAIVRRVLIAGESQGHVAREAGCSRQRVSSLVKTFWKHFERMQPLPAGWSTQTVTLPADAWAEVRRIEARAKARLAGERHMSEDGPEASVPGE